MGSDHEQGKRFAIFIKRHWSWFCASSLIIFDRPALQRPFYYYSCR
jgi:hypothetical protein